MIRVFYRTYYHANMYYGYSTGHVEMPIGIIGFLQDMLSVVVLTGNLEDML